MQRTINLKWEEFGNRWVYRGLPVVCFSGGDYGFVRGQPAKVTISDRPMANGIKIKVDDIELEEEMRHRHYRVDGRVNGGGGVYAAIGNGNPAPTEDTILCQALRVARSVLKKPKLKTFYFRVES